MLLLLTHLFLKNTSMCHLLVDTDKININLSVT